MRLFLLVGWSTQDGNVVSYVFTNAEKRSDFYDMMEKNAKADPESVYFWIHNWHNVEKDSDPSEISETYDTE